jgi:homocysteine S-methyltransferase
MPVNTLKKRLVNGERIIMDGALGTEILNRGVSTKLPLWSAEALITHPEVVQQIHEDYINAGAEIIVTNTFCTTQRVLDKGRAGKDARDLTLKACELAHAARDKTGARRSVYIAGSVAPLEDCYSPELTPPKQELDAEHKALARQLEEGGVDFILIETMITLRETLAALRAAQAVGMPVAVSFCCNDKLELLGGEALSKVVPIIEIFDPLFIGVNCVSTDIAGQTVKHLRELTDLPIAVYAQGDGIPDDENGWQFTEDKKRQTYLSSAKQWVSDGTQIIGSCCGSSPSYTKDLKSLIAKVEAT